MHSHAALGVNRELGYAPAGARPGMSAVIVRVRSMRTNHPGVMGRYQVKCGQGLCALTGEHATSKLEGALFALLHYVIGGGRQDVRVPIGGREARLDIVFDLPGARTLVVEYDGEYWHRLHRKEISSRPAMSSTTTARSASWSGSANLRSNRQAMAVGNHLTCRFLPTWMPRPARGSSSSISFM